MAFPRFKGVAAGVKNLSVDGTWKKTMHYRKHRGAIPCPVCFKLNKYEVIIKADKPQDLRPSLAELCVGEYECPDCSFHVFSDAEVTTHGDGPWECEEDWSSIHSFSVNFIDCDEACRTDTPVRIVLASPQLTWQFFRGHAMTNDDVNKEILAYSKMHRDFLERGWTELTQEAERMVTDVLSQLQS